MSSWPGFVDRDQVQGEVRLICQCRVDRADNRAIRCGLRSDYRSGTRSLARRVDDDYVRIQESANIGHTSQEQHDKDEDEAELEDGLTPLSAMAYSRGKAYGKAYLEVSCTHLVGCHPMPPFLVTRRHVHSYGI
jgi:hypothetical protein